ncbi:CRE-GLY-18 protein [Caenorhabditis remanei]|uniref:CRE-GLY-18 protein n=1 Tax=Caenorhabditis remanei TaxID=31234 RepID=E3NGZ1_CAERE|nr:CRE-GLY-18 protein [Caenorhabditis remanei]
MVRIFKAMNGTANVEVKSYQSGRLRGKNHTESPLPLFKSSLSALIPREASNELASSLMPRELLEFLEDTGIADEGFWGTLLGNRKKFSIPGSLDFQEWIDYRENQSSSLKWPTDGWRYYISRDQVWTKSACRNYMTSGSCVFGIGDVPRLLTSKALVAHKFYLKSEPEAYFCLKVRRRSSNPDPKFSASMYSELPQVELSRGFNMSQLTHQNWIL